MTDSPLFDRSEFDEESQVCEEYGVWMEHALNVVTPLAKVSPSDPQWPTPIAHTSRSPTSWHLRPTPPEAVAQARDAGWILTDGELTTSQKGTLGV